MISDWILRRVIKLFLKKNLAHLFAMEVDVEQLGVQIESGVVEMRDCLLDPSFLNSKVVRHYETLNPSAISMRTGTSRDDVPLVSMIGKAGLFLLPW